MLPTCTPSCTAWKGCTLASLVQVSTTALIGFRSGCASMQNLWVLSSTGFGLFFAHGFASFLQASEENPRWKRKLLTLAPKRQT
eukprot:2600344-Amphidinium_carterae.1